MDLFRLETTLETNSAVVIRLSDNTRNVSTFHESKLLESLPSRMSCARDQKFGVKADFLS